MTEFKVGDRVHHDVRGDAEITYGPFDSPWGGTRYVIRLDSGKETAVSPGTLSAIPEPPKFAIGDKVTTRASRQEGRLVAGPFVSRFGGRRFWVVESTDGKHEAPSEESLTKLSEPEPVKVGDRVRVVKDSDGYRAGQYIGRVGVVAEVEPRNELPYKVRFGDGSGFHGDPDGHWWCEVVERVTDEDTYTHNGVTYDLSAKYRDRDGDVWHFARFGDKVVGLIGRDPVDEHDGDPFRFAAGYGPLTRVTD
ncbi:phiSA1p31-related protein [Streptomyces sp. NPDC058960]|uniref:phiSA1p31-related protein n=1 Tax=Streptomyces sp. NPDC058960 TaxID=3346679 RepID=UPI00367ED541